MYPLVPQDDPRHAGWRGWLGALLVFALLSAGFLWQPFLTGQVFLPTDLSYGADVLWRDQARPVGLAVDPNPLLSDVALYYYPYASYTMQRLQQGAFPLWDPYILTGTPFFAAAQAAVLDPINLLCYLAGPRDYWLWSAWLRLTLLGWATYGFLRALGRSAAAGLGAGITFMLCGFVVVWLHYSVVTTVVWLPWLFWATTRLLQTGRLGWVVATAFALGGLLLGGHPETQFLVGVIWCAYIVYNLRRPPGPVRAAPPHLLPHLITATILGGSLAAVQVIPFANFLLQSNAIAARTVPLVSRPLQAIALHLIIFFFPNFSGTPQENNYWYLSRTNLNFNEQTGYIGLLTLALGLGGTLYWARRDRQVAFFAGLAGLALLLALQVPGLHLLKALPLFNIGHGVRWALVWSFAGAVLAGYGVDALRALRVQSGAWRRIGGGLLSAACLGGLLLLSVYLGLRQAGPPLSGPAAIGYAQMLHLFHPLHLTLYWPVIFLAGGGLVLLAGGCGWVRPWAALTLLLLLLYADLWTFGSRYNPVTPAAAIYPATPITRAMQAWLGHERMAAVANTLLPNTGLLFGLRDLRGYEDVVDQSFMRLYQARLARLAQPAPDGLQMSPAGCRLLEIAGVRYLVLPRGLRLRACLQRFQPRFTWGSATIYENPAALPRAYVVFNALRRPDLPTATTALLDPVLDPRRTVILTDGTGADSAARPTGVAAAAGVARPPDATARVTWQQDDPEQIVLTADLPAPGYLVLSDNYTADWTATLDGQPVPLWRANVVYRAVLVPAGRHRVGFYYRPRLFYASAWLSGSAAAVLIGLAILAAYRAARSRPART